MMARAWSNETTGRPSFEESVEKETLPKELYGGPQLEYSDISNYENDHAQQISTEDDKATHLRETPSDRDSQKTDEESRVARTRRDCLVGNSVVPPFAATSSEPEHEDPRVIRDNGKTRCCPATNVLISLVVLLVSITVAALISWKETKPLVCQPLPKVEYGEISCPNGHRVNSICTIKCVDNHQIQGHEKLTCLNDASWSFDEPSCVCSNCSVGDKCQYSIKWNDVANALDSIVRKIPKVVNYGGHAMVCEGRYYKALRFHGKCTDTEEKREYDCNRNKHGYKSVEGAAKHAASKLIREMVNIGKYPKPCDSQDMETKC